MKEIRIGETADFSLVREWGGQPLSEPLPIWLCHDRTTLSFTCSFPRVVHTFPGTSGEFYRGLWERDVAELFLHFPSGYVELHLAPNGLWWAALFRAYRQEERELPDLSPKILRAGTELTIAFEKEKLPVPLSAVNSLAVTAILSGRFLSFISLPETKPDFHRNDISVSCLFRED